MVARGRSMNAPTVVAVRMCRETRIMCKALESKRRKKVQRLMGRIYEPLLVPKLNRILHSTSTSLSDARRASERFCIGGRSPANRKGYAIGIPFSVGWDGRIYEPLLVPKLVRILHSTSTSLSDARGASERFCIGGEAQPTEKGTLMRTLFCCVVCLI